VSNQILYRFGIQLRLLRLQHGISQEKLAEMSGLHRTYIGDLERGKRNPSLTTMYQLSKALGVSIDMLLDFD
jgi:transcriptional regulator with XRE-family HTH domain